MVYNTFDWGIRDADGYFYILGRTDDVINVAGHRLGTREIEESISGHPTWPKWRWWAWPMRSRARWRWPSRAQGRGSLVTDADAALKLEGEIMKVVDDQLGAVARPARVRFVTGCCPRRAAANCCAAPSRPCARARPGRPDHHRRPAALQQIANSYFLRSE
jgi:propionyl-CoA synthetase